MGKGLFHILMMKTRTLKNQILASFAIVIAVLSVCSFGLGYYVVKTDIFERIQGEVERSLDGEIGRAHV